METLLLAALALALFGTYRASHASDCSIAAGWLVLVPVLSGAQHGMLYGMGSAGVLCAGGLLQFSPLAELGVLVLHGWGLLYSGVGAIAGYFHDLMERRYAQLSARERVSSEELQALERAFSCLQWSHAQLEQQFCTQPYSLAGILDATEERLQELRSSEAMAELMLEVIASRTSVEAASLYALAPYSQVAPVPLASLGAPQLDVPNHPLVQRALRTGGLVSIVDAPARAQAAHGVLVAASLHSSCGQLQLMFVVHQMPFDAFGVEQLRNLHGLLARLVDMVQQRIDALDGEPRLAAARAQHAEHGPLTSWADAAGDSYASPRLRASSSKRAQLR